MAAIPGWSVPPQIALTVAEALATVLVVIAIILHLLGMWECRCKRTPPEEARTERRRREMQPIAPSMRDMERGDSFFRDSTRDSRSQSAPARFVSNIPTVVNRKTVCHTLSPLTWV